MSENTTPMKLADSSADHDRRSETRLSAQLKVTLSTPGGQPRELVTKDKSFSGISFISDESLAIGQDCHIVLENADHTFARFLARVVRTHSTDEGQYEIAVQFRRQIAA